MTALAVVVLWAAYLVREVLLLIYMSGLLAIGFSPIVRLIERQQVLPVGTRRFPRWLAILVLYLFIIGALVGIGFLIVPPLVHQGQQLWGALPEMFENGAGLPGPEGLLEQPLTMQEAVARAPVTQGGDAVGTVFGAIAGVVGGLFGFLTILILTFYLLVEADQLRASLLQLFPRKPAHDGRRGQPRHHAQGQRLAGRPTGARRDYRGVVCARLVADWGAVLLRAGAYLRNRRTDPGRRPDSVRDPGDRGGLQHLAEDCIAGDCLLRGPAAVREPHPRAEGDGAAGRRQRGHGDRRHSSSAANCSASSGPFWRCRPRQFCRCCSPS